MPTYDRDLRVCSAGLLEIQRRFYGKPLAMLVRNFRARVLLYPSARLEIQPSKADMPVFEDYKSSIRLHVGLVTTGYTHPAGN